MELHFWLSQQARSEIDHFPEKVWQEVNHKEHDTDRATHPGEAGIRVIFLGRFQQEEIQNHNQQTGGSGKDLAENERHSRLFFCDSLFRGKIDHAEQLPNASRQIPAELRQIGDLEGFVVANLLVEERDNRRPDRRLTIKHNLHQQQRSDQQRIVDLPG